MPILDKQLWSSVQSRILLLLLLHSSAIFTVSHRGAGCGRQETEREKRKPTLQQWLPLFCVAWLRSRRDSANAQNAKAFFLLASSCYHFYLILRPFPYQLGFLLLLFSKIRFPFPAFIIRGGTYKKPLFVCALVIRARFPTFTLFSLSLPPPRFVCSIFSPFLLPLSSWEFERVHGRAPPQPAAKKVAAVVLRWLERGIVADLGDIS